MRVIQAELDRVAQHWNLHRIRPQHNVESPPGRPDTLFFLPELEGNCISHRFTWKNNIRQKIKVKAPKKINLGVDEDLYVP